MQASATCCCSSLRSQIQVLHSGNQWLAEAPQPSRLVHVRRVYGIPSYWVQKVFSEVQGVRYAPTGVASDLSLVHTERVAASTTCQDAACTDLAVKVLQPLPASLPTSWSLSAERTRCMAEFNCRDTSCDGLACGFAHVFCSPEAEV